MGISSTSVGSGLIGYIERGEIKPVVAETYPLSAIVDAQQELLTKQHTGKIVLMTSVNSTTYYYTRVQKS